MRTLLLALVLVSSLAGCASKKKSVANPASSSDTSHESEREEQDMATPDGKQEDDATKSSDPCEGGE